MTFAMAASGSERKNKAKEAHEKTGSNISNF